jgi:HlyD family secretion protein
LTLAAFDYQTFAATVERLSAVGSTSGGVTTYPVLLRVDSQAAFFAGMSASADIVVGQRQQVLTVPLAALKVDGARVYVTRVITNDQGRQTTEDVSVSVGLVDAAKAEITAGLIDGDLIALAQNNTAASPAGFNFGRR